MQRVQSSETERFLDAIGQVRIVKDNVEAEHFGPEGDGTADATEADNAERVAADSSAAGGAFANLFWALEFLAFSDLNREKCTKFSSVSIPKFLTCKIPF